jgi:hypothetical protein
LIRHHLGRPPSGTTCYYLCHNDFESVRVAGAGDKIPWWRLNHICVVRICVVEGAWGERSGVVTFETSYPKPYRINRREVRCRSPQCRGQDAGTISTLWWISTQTRTHLIVEVVSEGGRTRWCRINNSLEQGSSSHSWGKEKRLAPGG